MVAGMLDQWWPSTQFLPETEDAWFGPLAGYDADVVSRAVAGLLRKPEHKQFRPALPALLAEIEAMTAEPVPSFTEVFDYVWGQQGALKPASSDLALNRLRSAELKAMAHLERLGAHRWVGAWLMRRGVGASKMEEVNGDEHGPIRYRLANEWQGYVESAAEREQHGELVTAASEKQRMGAELGHVKALDALGLRRPELEAGEAAAEHGLPSEVH